MAEMREIPGYSDYYASDVGDIFSMKPFPANKKDTFPRLRKLKPWKAGKGYYMVHLSIDGKYPKFYVHRLVLLTFVGPCPPNHEGCHGSNGKKNNSLANLYYGTHSKNCNEDKLRDGTALIGSKHHQAKLTEEQVLEIRKLHGKLSQRKIAETYGVLQQQISRIQSKQRWAHI